jgi:transcriptional regulator with XRE-family HTH domain
LQGFFYFSFILSKNTEKSTKTRFFVPKIGRQGGGERSARGFGGYIPCRLSKNREIYRKNAVFWRAQKAANYPAAPLAVAMRHNKRNFKKNLHFVKKCVILYGMESKADKESEKQASAALIRDARHRCGLNVGEFAKECGVSYQYLSQLEHAMYSPSEKFLRNMQNALERHKIPDTVCSTDEAHILGVYRKLSPESRQAITNAVDALYAAQPPTPAAS